MLPTPAQAGVLDYLAYQSDIEDYVGDGRSKVLDEPGAMSGHGYPHTFTLHYSGQEDWSIIVSAKTGQELVLGTGQEAERSPTSTVAGLSFFGEGRGCNTSTGEFDLQEYEFDESNNLVRLAIDFVQHCEGGIPALRGSIRFSSDIGPALSSTGTLQVRLDGIYGISDPYMEVYPWDAIIDPEPRYPVGFEETSATGFFELLPGEYAIIGANYDSGEAIHWDYFPEWYRDVPRYRYDRITRVKVTEGGFAQADMTLDPLFDDMFDHLFFEDIAWMKDVGITSGCSLELYCPDDLVTRGQMAAFLVRALGLPATEGGPTFVDDDMSEFEADIEKLAAAGITKGCGENRFCPDDRVTRGQMAAFLVRAMGYQAVTSTDFADDDDSVFELDIEKLAAAGVTKGCNPPANDRFCPNDPVTRGQMAAFLHRALGGELFPADADWSPASPADGPLQRSAR